MIDIHAHILPGFDDGAQDIDTALIMAKAAQNDGVTAIIATPHCFDGKYYCRKEEIILGCQLLNKLLKKKNISLTIFPGAENHITADMVALYRQNKLLTLADTHRAILLELPQVFMVEAVAKVLVELKASGLTGIIAHPERNASIRDYPEIIDELIYAGGKMQLTADSLLSNFDKSTELFATWMVREHKIHYIASDCHSPRHRPPKLQKAYSKLAQVAGLDFANGIKEECVKLLS